jgi:hypothetical protein
LVLSKFIAVSFYEDAGDTLNIREAKCSCPVFGLRRFSLTLQYGPITEKCG